MCRTVLFLVCLAMLAGMGSAMGATLVQTVDPQISDSGFGCAMSMSGSDVAIGADQENSQTGAVYVYTLSDGSMALDGKVQGAEPHDLFGDSVAMGQDKMLVGATNKGGGGGAYFYLRTGGAWVKNKEVSSPGSGGGEFGVAVAMDGTRAAIGDQEDDTVDDDTGLVVAYDWNSWSGWYEKQVIYGDTVYGKLGSSAAMNGNRMLVGAPTANARGQVAAYEYEDGNWLEKQTIDRPVSSTKGYFGLHLAMDGDLAVISDHGEGQAYVYRYSGGGWTHEGTLAPPSAQEDDQFGRGVAVHGEVVAVSAFDRDGVGAVYVFEIQNSIWTCTDIVSCPEQTTDHTFGFSIALTDGHLLVGDIGVSKAYLFSLGTTPQSNVYYLPAYTGAEDMWTGIGLANLSVASQANVTVSSYESDGTAIAAENQVIDANGQSAFVAADSSGKTGWIRIDSDQPLAGLAFMGGKSMPNHMADIPFATKLINNMVVPHVAQSDEWDTTIYLANPGSVQTTATLTFVDTKGVAETPVDKTMVAGGSIIVPLTDLISIQRAGSGKVLISADNGICAFALYSNLKFGGYCYAGINAVEVE